MTTENYRELAEHAMVLLGETPPSGKFRWKKAVACHKARFMVFWLYRQKAIGIFRPAKPRRRLSREIQ